MSGSPDLWELTREICSDQRQRWEVGDCVAIEVYLAQYPELAATEEAARELIYNELLLREEFEQPSDEEHYRARFPGQASFLSRLFEVHRLLHDSGLAEFAPSTGSSRGHEPAPAKSRLESRSRDIHDLAEGQDLGRYRLLELIGEGTFAKVWKAQDARLDRLVAIKLPRRHQLDERAAERFQREARAGAQLAHPGIASLHDVAYAAGQGYIVTDFIDGVELGQWRREQPPSFREIARLVEAIAAALQHAHAHGVIHRDIKPSNILVDAAGQPHITDFGLALRPASEATLTVDGDILGTPIYMSPEQANGESHRVDARSDVYSLGVVLYELLTGEQPFHGTFRMVQLQVLHEEPRPPRKVNDQVPKDLEAITLKAMAKEPAQRYGSAEQMAQDLARYLAGEHVKARPASAWSKFWAWCCRPERVNEAGALMLFYGAVLVVFSLFGSVVLATGLHPTADPMTAVQRLLLLISCLYLPLMVAGLWTARRRPAGLWLAFGLMWAGFGVSVAGLAGVRIFGGNLHVDPQVRLPLYSLLALTTLIGVLLISVALLAYHANRAVMGWTRR